MSRYAIIGVGALGGFYAAKLIQAGHEVHLLLNSDFEHVQDQGLRVDSVNGDMHIKNPLIYKSFEDIPPVDYICISTKSTQNHILFPMLEKMSQAGSVIVVMQNGYGLEQLIARSLPDRILVGALCFICSQKIGPGHIKHMDYGSVRFGALSQSDRQETVVLAELAADFAGAGIETHILQNLILARWQKLMWNIPFNGLCTLLRQDTLTLINHPNALALILSLMKEVQKGAAICGAEIPDSFIEKMIQDTSKMTPYKPSMQLDFENGRPLEWDAIYQKPLEAVRELGGDMPKVEVLMHQLACLSMQKPTGDVLI